MLRTVFYSSWFTLFNYFQSVEYCTLIRKRRVFQHSPHSLKIFAPVTFGTNLVNTFKIKLQNWGTLRKKKLAKQKCPINLVKQGHWLHLILFLCCFKIRAEHLQVLTQEAHTDPTPRSKFRSQTLQCPSPKQKKAEEETAKSSPEGRRHRARPAGGGAGALQAPSTAPCDGYELARLKDAI